MTHHPIKILEDGTRVYSNYTRYKPLAPEQRKYGINKPDDPRAVLWSSRWWVPLEMLDRARRVMPATRPDSEGLGHLDKQKPCKCDVCTRPGTGEWIQRQIRKGSSRSTPS